MTGVIDNGIRFLPRFYRVLCGRRSFSASSLKFYASPEVTSSTPLTLVEDIGSVRTITLNNVKKRNALSLAMLTELHGHLNHAASTSGIKAVVIGHEGPVFSSGHDLKELTAERGTDFHAQVFNLCSEVMKLVQVRTILGEGDVFFERFATTSVLKTPIYITRNKHNRHLLTRQTDKILESQICNV